MLGIRAVWIISLFPRKSRKIIFFRRFLTVERKTELEQGKNYVPVPAEGDFLRSVLFTLGLTCELNELSGNRTGNRISFPVVAIKVHEEELWPLMLLEQHSHLFCCLPAVKETSNHVLHWSDMAVGFSLLLSMSSFFESKGSSSQLPEKIMELDSYLSLNVPFGTPFDTDPLSCETWLNKKASKSGKWMSRSSKTTASVALEMKEFIRSAQHNRLKSEAEVCGSVTAKVDSLSNSNEISVSFESGDVQGCDIDSLLMHPCIQTFIKGGSGQIRRLRFCPMQKELPLFFYKMKFSEMPIIGTYKLKCSPYVELAVHLKLNDNVKNSVSFCEVEIPFFSRSSVKSFEYKASLGYLYATEDRSTLKWNCGKFVSDRHDAYLTVKVEFSDSQDCSDQFYGDANSYIQINFRLSDASSSHFVVSPKTVTTSTSQKVKLTKDFSRRSNEYQVWNTFGELSFPAMDDGKWPSEQFAVD